MTTNSELSAFYQTLDLIKIQTNSKKKESVKKSLKRLLKFIAYSIEEKKYTTKWINLACNSAVYSLSFPIELQLANQIHNRRFCNDLSQILKDLLNMGLHHEAFTVMDALIKVSEVMPNFLLRNDFLNIFQKEMEINDISDNVKALMALKLLKMGDITGSLNYINDINQDSELSETIISQLCLSLAENGFRKEGRYIAGLSSLNKGYSVIPSDQMFNRIHLLIQLEDISSVKRLIQVIDFQRLNLEKAGLLFSYKVRFGNPEYALEMIPFLVREDEIWRDTYLYEAFACKMLFRFEDAIKALDHDETYNDIREQNIIYRAKFLSESGKLDQSLYWVEFGLKHISCSDPETQGVLYDLKAKLNYSLGQIDQAISDHRKATELYPLSWMIHYNFALTLKSVYHFQEALEILSLGIQKNRFVNNPCLYLFDSIKNYENGGFLKSDLAIKCLNQAEYTATPWLPYRLYNFLLAMNSLYMHGMEEEYRAVAKKIKGMHGLFSEPGLSMICLFIEQGKPLHEKDMARTLIQAALPEYPENGHDHNILLSMINAH